MKTTLVVRLLQTQDQQLQYSCCRVSEHTTSDWRHYDSLELLVAAECEDQEQDVGVLIPGQLVGQAELTFSRGELRHLENLAPFQLEDELIGSVEDLHFVYSKPQPDGDEFKVWARWVNREWLQQQYASFAAAGAELSHCWTDADMAAVDQQQGWTFQLDGSVIVRLDDQRSYAVEESLAGVFIDRLAAQETLAGQSLPESALLVAPSDADLGRIRGHLSEHFNGVLVTDTDTLRPSLARLTSAMDFAVGEFAQMLPFATWWRQWRAVTVLAGVALFLYVGSVFLQVGAIISQQQQVRKDIEAAYRTAVPQGNLVDPERQLQNKVGGSGSVSGSGFIPLIAKVTPAFERIENVRVSSMNYQASTNELQLAIEAESFADIESFRSDLGSSGVNAELVNSSARRDKHQAKLKVSGVY